MPGYKMHLVGGAVAAILLFSFPPTNFLAHLTLEQQFFFGSIALMGALFPDIDIKSKGQKILSWMLFPAISFTIIMHQFNFLALLSLLALFPLIINHRGITHNPWFIIGMPLTLFFIIKACVPTYEQELLCATLFFITGAFSHLILDFGPLKLFTRDKRGF